MLHTTMIIYHIIRLHQYAYAPYYHPHVFICCYNYADTFPIIYMDMSCHILHLYMSTVEYNIIYMWKYIISHTYICVVIQKISHMMPHPMRSFLRFDFEKWKSLKWCPTHYTTIETYTKHIRYVFQHIHVTISYMTIMPDWPS